jgi:flagellar basal body-associated protein FliL
MVRGNKMKKAIKIASIAVAILLISGSVSVYSALHNFGEKWMASHPTETLSETATVSETTPTVSLTQEQTMLTTNTIISSEEATTVKPTEKETQPTTVATTKELKYKVVGASTREYVADGMKNNNKEHRFLFDHPQIFVRSFAYNNSGSNEVKAHFYQDSNHDHYDGQGRGTNRGAYTGNGS